MQFYTRKRANPVVPIVSLIDILAILLIFFIVTTTFKERKALLAIDLPATKSLVSAMESRERLTIAVTRDSEIYLDTEPVKLEDLEGILGMLKAESDRAKLELKADETVELGLLVRIWDAITGAGFRIRDVPARIIVQPEGEAPAGTPER
ncbi:MAG TPA: biopolymer transporter ExbD [Longimicrobiaceae bacterium]|nr:biopolymer transporter ExbD [Longimicrobiaceae bacterium]